mmetsp:Transcript_6870/g.9505  ORF Transcript_6870/g.9505 Transcript_6870/m.9505 type:complete len:171 (-) Transcript_6870:526-1038(-)
MVVSKQLVQIPVCPTHSLTTFSHNAEIVLPTLSYKEVVPTAGFASPFFHSALEFQMESGQTNLKFFELQSAEGAAAMSFQGKSLVADKCFVAAEDSIAFMEASCPVTQNNKESLSTLFDLADESGCSIFVACVQRDRADFKDIVKTYLMLGFQMTQNWKLPNYVLLGKEL